MIDRFISKLDNERFGFRVAKIDCDTTNIESVLRELHDCDVKLIIARANSKDIKTINLLENAGFQLKDMQVTYRYDIESLNFNLNAIHPEILIREFVDHDIEEIVAIAKKSFLNYGHYFANAKLDKNICKEIYPDWARRSCIDKKYADKIFVAVANQETAGFLSFKILEESGRKYAKGVMGAVAQQYRKLGIFQSLIKQGLFWGKEIDLIWEEHNVHSNNYSVNRSFSSLGFFISNAFVTMHYWIE